MCHHSRKAGARVNAGTQGPGGKGNGGVPPARDRSLAVSAHNFCGSGLKVRRCFSLLNSSQPALKCDLGYFSFFLENYAWPVMSIVTATDHYGNRETVPL